MFIATHEILNKSGKVKGQRSSYLRSCRASGLKPASCGTRLNGTLRGWKSRDVDPHNDTAELATERSQRSKIAMHRCLTGDARMARAKERMKQRAVARMLAEAKRLK